MKPIQLGALTIWPFGLIFAGLLIPFFAWIALRQKKCSLDKGTASWFALLAVPLCFVLARLLYCVMTADQILDEGDFGIIFRTGEGGFLLWGAIAGLLLAAKLTGKITHQSGARIADSAAVPALLLIAAVRILCGLMFENFGTGAYLDEWFAPEEADFTNRYSVFALADWSFFECFPFAVQDYYESWCWAIFSLQALFAAGAAFWVHRVRAADGGKAAWFVVLYACGTIATESMLLHGEILHLPWQAFIKGNEVLSAAALLIVAAVCLCRLEKGSRLKPALILLPQFLAAVGIVIVMEFAAFEKKIPAIAWLPADACHLLSVLACLWIALAFRSLWKKAYAFPVRA